MPLPGGRPVPVTTPAGALSCDRCRTLNELGDGRAENWRQVRALVAARLIPSGTVRRLYPEQPGIARHRHSGPGPGRRGGRPARSRPAAVPRTRRPLLMNLAVARRTCGQRAQGRSAGSRAPCNPGATRSSRNSPNALAWVRSSRAICWSARGVAMTSVGTPPDFSGSPEGCRSGSGGARGPRRGASGPGFHAGRHDPAAPRPQDGATPDRADPGPARRPAFRPPMPADLYAADVIVTSYSGFAGILPSVRRSPTPSIPPLPACRSILPTGEADPGK